MCFWLQALAALGKKGATQTFAYQRGGEGGGPFWGCLRTRQPTHPPKLTHPPTHPDPPYPPNGGGGVLCCYNQLVTQKPCVFPPKKILSFSHCAISERI